MDGDTVKWDTPIIGFFLHYPSVPFFIQMVDFLFLSTLSSLWLWVGPLPVYGSTFFLSEML